MSTTIATMTNATANNMMMRFKASLLISLPTVAVGVLRHTRLHAFAEQQDLTQTVFPMGIGSVVGAVVGGLLVGFVPAAVLKVVLGVILIISAVRIFHH